MEDRDRNEAKVKAMESSGNFLAQGQPGASTGGISGAENKCASTGIPSYDPRANLLRQIDYAEDRLISELAMLRDARRTINFAGYEAIHALDQFTKLEQLFRRY